MTKQEFHELMIDPTTPDRLDRMLADNARIDEADDRQRALNDRIYTEAVRTWFQRTDQR